MGDDETRIKSDRTKLKGAVVIEQQDENVAAAKLDVILVEKNVGIPKTKPVVEKNVGIPKTKPVVVSTKQQDEQDEQQNEQQNEKVAAASKLGGIKEPVKLKEKKLELFEMAKIVGKPKTVPPSEQWTNIPLDDKPENTLKNTPENTDDIPEKTFLFRMIKNRRFKKFFEKCCNCNNIKCNCGSK